MNRRDFVGRLGTLAAAGAAMPVLGAQGVGVQSGTFPVNESPLGLTRLDLPAGAGLSLGYIPQSADFVMASALPDEPLTLRQLWAPDRTNTAISILGYVQSAAPTLERVDISVDYALPVAPFRVPFHAWQYVSRPGQCEKCSSPLTFTAGASNAAGLTADFRVKHPTTGEIASGTLHYRIGGSGMGPGIYALAGPSPSTGGAPDWSQLTWGETPGLLRQRDGGAVDFDYVTLVLRPSQNT